MDNADTVLYMNDLGPGKDLQRRRARTGYLVWGLVALVIAVPEIWGTFGNPWFYSISQSTAHLEDLWNGVRAIVVALIVVAAVHAVLYRPDMPDFPRSGVKSLLLGRPIRRTSSGRLTIKAGQTIKEGGEEGAPSEDFTDKVAIPYLVASAGAVALAGVLAGVPRGDKYWQSYLIYGLIAVFFVIIPNVVAYFFGRDFPFTTLFATVQSLERTRNFVTMIIIAGLAVLTFHLALYPWPDIRLTPG